MALDRLAVGLGRGIVAGAAGAAAMTASSTAEMLLRGREASDAPGRAAARLLRVKVKDDPATGRLALVAHVTTGLSLGAARGLMASAGLRDPVAGAVLFAASLTPDAVAVPALGIAPAPWRWSATDIAVSVLHHAVFTLAASAVYARLERRTDATTT